MTAVWTSEAAASADFVALDTEFHRERTYFAQLALLQLAADDDIVVVDPLAVDVSPLRALMEGPVPCIMHAASQDLEILERACGMGPCHLVDTQVAAGFVGLGSPGLGVLLQPVIVLCFTFFVLQTAAGVGLQTFLPASLNGGLGVALVVATSAVTAYLLGGTAGIVAGGFLASQTLRHDRVAATGLAAGATLLALIAAGWIPLAAIVVTIGLVGFAIGATGPSRDLIVRHATPRGAAGRVYGFVYSGLDLGGTLAPAGFGWMLDHRQGRGVLFVVAGLFVTAIFTVINVRRAGVAVAAGA